MIRLKILLLLMIFAYNEVSSKCTASQSNKMMTCSATFFDSIGFYESDEPDVLGIVFGLTTSWSNVESFCGNFEELKTCLGVSVIQNCVDLKKDIKSMSDYLDFGFGFTYIAGNYVCGDGHKTLEKMYSCGLSHCKIDDSTCESTKNSIKKCMNAAKDICDKTSLQFLDTILNLRECFKNPDCGLCGDKSTTQKVKEYRSKMNAGKKEKNNILKEFTKASQSSDFEFQLNALTKLGKQLSAKKLSKDIVVNEGYLPIFGKYLSSKSPNVQAEAAASLKYLIDGSSENLEAILKAEIIPALIRTLNSMDENILENVIETLATIISKQPKLRNLYMDLNIVESMLMSYTLDIPTRMNDDMCRIIIYLLQSDEIQFSSKTKSRVTGILPTLAELIYTFDSKTIITFVRGILELKLKIDRSDIFIDEEVLEKCFELLFHKNDEIRIASLYTITLAAQNENSVEFFLDKGILKYIKNELIKDEFIKNKESELSLSYAGFLFLMYAADSENTDHFQAILDAGLFPLIITRLNPEYDFSLRIAAITITLQISNYGTQRQISTLVKLNIIPTLCQILQNLDSEQYDGDNDKETLEKLAFLTIYFLIENSEDPQIMVQFKENDGEEIVKRFVTHEDLKEHALELSLKMTKKDPIFGDEIYRDEL